ncbi:DUF2730 family protein [Mesorhizobium sp. ES1-1]|uniref:DUF2730 family protein n=1 Tax=Mesorhizobium sp. ES1-1 TaxID=2876629 RepID=UPI001CCC895B|nr:DUF2730 family protein [Mesorhizobium sp. ES1-1]MBZ9678911.1 DUF2730 domain-containing protein [Mesorhizobium sp. ES1-1]
MDPTWVKLISDFSPALAAGVALTLLVIVAILKLFGFTGIADKSKLVNEGKLNASLSAIEKRLATVENDITNRPTREEMHRLELSFTRLEGEVRSQGMTIQSTAAAIGRIEDYMYTAAAQRRGSGA